jgi:fructokinase
MSSPSISSRRKGAGAGCYCVFGVIIGTGTGGGLIFNRAIWRGTNAIAGEWGHNPLSWPTRSELDGPRCYCGKTGCIETYLSGAGLARAYEEVGSRNSASPQTITALFEAGDSVAATAISLYSDRLARGLASVINVVDPDIVVLGGGLSNIAALYALIPDTLKRYVFSDHLETKVVPAAHGDSGGVRGAAWLWGSEPGALAGAP